MANKGHSPKIQTVLLYAGVLVNLCMIIWLGGFTFRHHGADELTRASGNVVEAGKAQIAQHERWLKRLEHQLEQKVQNSAAVDVVGPARTINPPPAGSIHVVFSIECRINHHWQAEALFYSFHQLNHAGYITCLYSCNSPGDMNKTRIKMRFPRAIIHWTPLYNPYRFTESHNMEDNYPPTNRPYALSHWLEHGDVHGDTIVILDPDMLMMRKWEKPAPLGKPYGQRYIFGGLDWHKNDIAKKFCKRCLKMPQNEIHEKYTPGAPYVMHITDLKRIVPMWQDVMRGIRELKQSGKWSVTAETAWISDMIGFSIASIHHNMPWNLREDMMLSRAGDPEAWARVSWKTKTEDLPHVLHYCQPYEVDRGKPTFRRFYKHDDFYERMRWNALRCGMKIEIETDDLPTKLGHDDTAAAKSMVAITEPERADKSVMGFRNAWMLKHVVEMLNSAFLNWQTFHLCPKNMLLKPPE